MTTQTPPERYRQASEMGKPFLRLLAIKDEDLDRECRLVMEDNGYIHDAYLFNACKYLWRLGDKDAVDLEVKKTLDFLIWFRDSNYVHRVPGLADDFDTRAVQTTIAALESSSTAT
jgi:hypothetical protein